MFYESLSLIIDSDMRSAKMAKEAIESLCEDEVQVVTSIDEALALVESKRILFIVINLDIGLEDCIIFSNNLRRNSDNSNYKTPIIALMADKNHLLDAVNSGMNGSLIKPFGVSALKDLIVKIISNPLNFIVSRNYVGPDRRTRNEKPNGTDQRNIRD